MTEMIHESDDRFMTKEVVHISVNVPKRNVYLFICCSFHISNQNINITGVGSVYVLDFDKKYKR